MKTNRLPYKDDPRGTFRVLKKKQNNSSLIFKNYLILQEKQIAKLDWKTFGHRDPSPFVILVILDKSRINSEMIKYIFLFHLFWVEGKTLLQYFTRNKAHIRYWILY